MPTLPCVTAKSAPLPGVTKIDFGDATVKSPDCTKLERVIEKVPTPLFRYNPPALASVSEESLAVACAPLLAANVPTTCKLYFGAAVPIPTNPVERSTTNLSVPIANPPANVLVALPLDAVKTGAVRVVPSKVKPEFEVKVSVSEK